MTLRNQILSTFYNNKNRMRLGDILRYPWGYEFRARATELRKEGYQVICERAKRPSDNLYILIPPEENGQTLLL